MPKPPERRTMNNGIAKRIQPVHIKDIVPSEPRTRLSAWMWKERIRFFKSDSAKISLFRRHALGRPLISGRIFSAFRESNLKKSHVRSLVIQFNRELQQLAKGICIRASDLQAIHRSCGTPGDRSTHGYFLEIKPKPNHVGFIRIYSSEPSSQHVVNLDRLIREIARLEKRRPEHERVFDFLVE